MTLVSTTPATAYWTSTALRGNGNAAPTSAWLVEMGVANNIPAVNGPGRNAQGLIPLTNGLRVAGDVAKLWSIGARREDGGMKVTAIYTGALKKIVWHIRDDGSLRCDYEGPARGKKDFIGGVLDYPEKNVTSKRWLGDGPFRVWKNRLAGNTFGVWSNSYNNTITGWRGWEYPEFKGCFANVRWLQLDTTEETVVIVSCKAR